MVTILAVGLFNSIMFPTIFTLAIDGLGDRTGQGSGVLCMAIVGGAILPVVQGAVADHAGVHLGFVVPMVSYAYIAWYGLAGSVKRPAGVAASSAAPKEASLPRATHS
jgi:FHS family L-fucose permease-like MFS transporter